MDARLENACQRVLAVEYKARRTEKAKTRHEKVKFTVVLEFSNHIVRMWFSRYGRYGDFPDRKKNKIEIRYRSLTGNSLYLPPSVVANYRWTENRGLKHNYYISSQSQINVDRF